jgi:hypothetical protein
MESAPLNKAHEHVRNAATATHDSSFAAAGAEHELAASAFHDAAQDTHNDEVCSTPCLALPWCTPLLAK